MALKGVLYFKPSNLGSTDVIKNKMVYVEDKLFKKTIEKIEMLIEFYEKIKNDSDINIFHRKAVSFEQKNVKKVLKQLKELEE